MACPVRFAICLAGVLVLAPAGVSGEEFQGPSSSQTPYLTSVAPGVKLLSLLTAGDAVPHARGAADYRMTGTPDGLGAFRSGRKLVVLMNHELTPTASIVRAHGSRGSFVSRWTLDIDSLRVESGEDQIRSVNLWDAASASFRAGTTAFTAFCSADLAPRRALFNIRTGKGYEHRMFLNGEEGGERRAFAHIVTGPDDGVSYELPSLGKFAWENALASPFRQDRTVVVGTDDTNALGQVYVYVGEKRFTGNPVERAGLHGGTLYGVKVAGVADESRAAPVAGTFSLAALGDVRSMTSADLEALSIERGVARFLRPEDGAWDTRDPDVFYFNTTDRYDEGKDGVGAQVGRSRLYRLRFSDIRHPELGGRIEPLSSDPGAQQMLDNMTVNAEGKLIVLEDVFARAHNSKVWEFDPATRAFTLLAQHDRARFGDIGLAPTEPFTADEESSGVIEITALVSDARWFERRYRYYLLDVQAHYPLDAEAVEGGQLLMMAVPGRRP
jgi:hypothetical protein